jgi:hypothetical protein
MALLTHPEEHKVQDGLSALASRGKAPQFRFGLGGGNLWQRLSPDAMDMSSENAQRSQKTVTGHAEIAFRVGRRHASFVGPEEMDPAQLKAALFGLAGDSQKELSRDPPP